MNATQQFYELIAERFCEIELADRRTKTDRRVWTIGTISRKRATMNTDRPAASQQVTLKAECMRCGKIHPSYEFKPTQLCYVLWCENCGTQMHKPVAPGRLNETPLTALEEAERMRAMGLSELYILFDKPDSQRNDIERVIIVLWQLRRDSLCQSAAEQLAALVTERDELQEFVSDLREILELHESHWGYQIRMGLEDLEAALMKEPKL